ncbi:MAG: hypothetical protein ABW128_07070 [Rhizorhabdus sp.]
MRDAFTIDLSTGNAAFQDEPGADAIEVARILRRIAKRLETGDLQGGCFDINGNRCGSWELMRADD